ncbi:hypothetical protein EV121DRAFT_265364, partial [Schizophyllum commune]
RKARASGISRILTLGELEKKLVRTLSPKASGRTSSGIQRRARQCGHPGRASQPLDPSRPPKFAG